MSCDCCHTPSKELNDVNIKIEDKIVSRKYCNYCMYELLKYTLKRTNREQKK